MTSISRAEFEREQARLKQEAAQADMMHELAKTQKNMRIYATAAHIYTQLMLFPQFRAFVEDNFYMLQGVDHETKKAIIQVHPRNAEWKPNTDEEMAELMKGEE